MTNEKMDIPRFRTCCRVIFGEVSWSPGRGGFDVSETGPGGHIDGWGPDWFSLTIVCFVNLLNDFPRQEMLVKIMPAMSYHRPFLSRRQMCKNAESQRGERSNDERSSWGLKALRCAFERSAMLFTWHGWVYKSTSSESIQIPPIFHIIWCWFKFSWPDTSTQSIISAFFC